jgi:hypothetical protein
VSAISGLLNASAALDARCPRAEPTRGFPAGFDDERRCRCKPDVAQQRDHSHIHLDGSTANLPRPCWEPAQGRKMAWAC